MKNAYLVVLLLISIFSLAACKMNPLVNVETAPLGAPPQATLEQVAHAIEVACASQGWRLVDQASGQTTAELNVSGGKHKATVDIEYDTETFSIVYLNSYNLNYSVERSVTYIHPNYLVWVDRLKNDIQRRAAAI